MNEANIIQFQQTVVRPFADGKHVIRSEFKERCFIYQSFTLEKSEFGDRMLRAHVTFLADSGKGVAAEWEPQHGPIQLWKACDESWRGKTHRGNPIEPMKHWHFDYVEDDPFAWSQMAVEEEGLRGMLSGGHLDGVFGVLKRWADR